MRHDYRFLYGSIKRMKLETNCLRSPLRVILENKKLPKNVLERIRKKKEEKSRRDETSFKNRISCFTIDPMHDSIRQTVSGISHPFESDAFSLMMVG